MNKTFSKDSLKVGDKVQTFEGTTLNVEEVLSNCFLTSYYGEELSWVTFHNANTNGWTIIPDEEENSASLSSVGATANWLDTPYIKKSIKEAIIKNNNEFIEEIEKIKCRRCKRNISECAKGRWSRPLCTVDGVTWDEHVIGISVIDNIIQSKNDLLSKE